MFSIESGLSALFYEKKKERKLHQEMLYESLKADDILVPLVYK